MNSQDICGGFCPRFSGTCSKRIKFSLFSLVDFRFKTVKDIERFSVPGEMSYDRHPEITNISSFF